MENNWNAYTDEELVRMSRSGNREAEEFLIQKYRGLAMEKSKTYFITGADRDDVIQEGMIGIFKAIRDYDEAGKASFHTFVELCITRQILTAVQGANRMKHQILNNSLSLNQEKEQAEDGVPMIEKLESGPSMDPEATAMVASVVESLMADGIPVFSPLENQVWTHLRSGLNYREIAERLGRSPKSVDNAIQRIKKKIAAYLR